ncbi:MAG: hypothetical protein LBQ68_06210 [Clostridiales bacterium]|jgi:ATP-dependent DNA helicase RecG|nr:hypothetical protein [Clostridiales bacterium]
MILNQTQRIRLLPLFSAILGLADELGSGVRNLYRYVIRYSGKDPKMIDGDLFRLIVPRDDSYSFDVETDKAPDQSKTQDKAQSLRFGSILIEQIILEYFEEHPSARQVDVAKAIGKSRRAIQDAVATLKERITCA